MAPKAARRSYTIEPDREPLLRQATAGLVQAVRLPILVDVYYFLKFQRRRLRPWCVAVLNRIWLQVLMFLITIYALIGDDTRLAFTAKPADAYYDILTITALVLFSFELVVSCVAKDDYFLSFFFWLDFVATVSLILDITWVYSFFMGEDSGLARAGRMSRIGTRAGRLIRVIRLIRLIRIIKLYKHLVDVQRRLRGQQVEVSGPGDDPDDENYAETRVGTKLSQLTTQKVIILVLVMLIALPTITVDEWFKDVPTSSQYGADVLYGAWLMCLSTNDTASREHFEQQLTMYIGYHYRQAVTTCDDPWNQAFSSDCTLDLGWVGFLEPSDEVRRHIVPGSLCDFSGGDFAWTKGYDDHWEYLFSDALYDAGTLQKGLRKGANGSWATTKCVDGHYASLLPQDVDSEVDLACPEGLRFAEYNFVEPRLVGVDDTPSLVFVYDLRPWQLRSAVFNMLQTVFICVMLAFGAMVFSNDANVLVLRPIERMISKVQKIRDNPLYAMKLGDEQYREQQKEEQQELHREQQLEQAWFRHLPLWCSKRGKKVQNMETKILENAIIKLGKLLALGFGEAGSEIIGKNMDDDSATVNAMIPGNKVEAVFGFCDIRNFTDTTDVLQDKVMVFVNQVAEIVHTTADAWHGAANRNIGDAFLIVWRMCEDFGKEKRTKLADMSVISFVQVVAAVNKSAVLKEYREHPALLARLPNYRVRLGFGLHYGWAIEGAIGSEFKIDASYLSPHINMVSRFVAATRHYDVCMLLSEPLVRLCSLEMAKYFRTIDRVTLKGGMLAPIRLHTVDLQGEVLEAEHLPPKDAKQYFEIRMQRERSKEERMQESFVVHALFEDDPDLVKMRQGIPKRFFQEFAKGYLNYEAGEWDVARVVLEKTRTMLGNADGPSHSLLDFMSTFDYDSKRVTKKGWLGCRELVEL